MKFSSFRESTELTTPGASKYSKWTECKGKQSPRSEKQMHLQRATPRQQTADLQGRQSSHAGHGWAVWTGAKGTRIHISHIRIRKRFHYNLHQSQSSRNPAEPERPHLRRLNLPARSLVSGPGSKAQYIHEACSNMWHVQSLPAQIAYLARAMVTPKARKVVGRSGKNMQKRVLSKVVHAASLYLTLFARLKLSAWKPAFPSGSLGRHDMHVRICKKSYASSAGSSPNSSSGVVPARFMSVRMPSVENSTRSSSLISKSSGLTSSTSKGQNVSQLKDLNAGGSQRKDLVILFPLCLIKLTGLGTGASCPL